MATSPSDPYKSRFVRGVVQQTRRWLDRGQTTIQRVKVAASWSAQVLLYPVYALFQTGRFIGKRIERSQQSARLHKLEPQRDDIPLTQEGAEFTPETAIQNVLQTLQTFKLPANCLVETEEAVAIRAISSLIDSQDIVLVTNYNQLLTIPDSEQQHWLKQRIIYEIAIYNRRYRSRKLPFQPVRRVLQGIRRAIQQRLSPTPSTTLLPAAATQDFTTSSPSDLASDLPIKRSLWTIRQWLATAEIPALNRSALKATKIPVLESSALKTLDSSAAIAQAQSFQLPASTTIRIRGVAALVSNQRLVLVSDTNDVLDILTPEQEQLLYQRIAWEVASYRRYLALRQQVDTLLPIRPPAKQSLILPPVRAFQWLMTWMQSGAVAMAANLFQEGSWLACPLPPTDVPPASSSAIVVPRPRFQRPRLVFTKHLLPATKPSSAISKSPASAPIPLTSTPVGQDLAVSSSQVAVLDATNDRSFLGLNEERVPDYIDTHVTWVNYEQSVFERVMRWLDRCFLWIETVIGEMWKSLRRR